MPKHPAGIHPYKTLHNRVCGPNSTPNTTFRLCYLFSREDSMIPETTPPETTPTDVTPPAAPPASPQTSTARNLFVSPQGLRSGWGVVLFILIFAAFAGATFGISYWLRHGKPSGPPPTEITLRAGFLQEAILVLMTLLTTWIMAKIERRGRSYGFRGTRKLAQFFTGIACGVGMISLLVLILWARGWLVFDKRLIFGADVIRYGFLWLLAFILVGIAEESLTRGYLLYTMTRGFGAMYAHLFKTRHSTALGFWTAASILSVIFFLGHTSNPGESPVGLLSVFLAGMFFSYSVWRSGSLWWAIGLHAAWDWGQSFLYGVADSGYMAEHHLLATHPQGLPLWSGGTTGPEGSILVVLVLALGVLLMWLTLPPGRYVDVPDQPQLPASAAA